ncbi:putative transmembrane protein [Senna tora]|uniref:Putative transmembrane protein n=1 Tax=Senna tora TaxID=362788 RepID=A0A834WQ04_9FABA|nr:putative transmembrane protein [Senna tora]
MDSTQEVPQSEGTKDEGFSIVTLRWILALILPILFFLSLPFLVGFLVVVATNLSIANPISIPAQCKIVSTGVDIRSSKICEFGLSNYKAKHTSRPFEKSKYRCHYDYYWASIFKVEYKDYISGQTLVAFAEAPNEALPLYCRPTFNVAWLTQYKFKVNETYNCWYTSGLPKVRLYQDDLFSCHADEQSTLETLQQYSILTMEMVTSWFSRRGRAKFLKWEVIAGVVTGFSTSLISIAFVKFLQRLLSSSR